MRQVRIVTESIKDQIYEILKQQICSGELKSGEQLVEQTIADRFSTSRSPVREAIKQLTGDGLVVNITNRGTFVKRPTAQEIREIQEMRMMIETYAIRKIAGSPTDEEKKELSGIRRRILEVQQDEDMDAYLHLEQEFWNTIVSLTHNSYIKEEYLKLCAIVFNFRNTAMQDTPDLFTDSADVWAGIVDAILSGNMELAVRQEMDHLRSATEVLCRLVAETE